MTTPKLSIIIPHKPGLQNDKALKLNIEMLSDNTTYDYELIIDNETPKDPYKIWNEKSKTAQADILVFSNSDVLMAKDWDRFFVEYMMDNAILTGYLVEAGNVGVATVNLPFDFGKTPDEFRRKEFENFAFMRSMSVPVMLEQRGWYMPCAVRKDWFLSTGGFDITLGFPNPNDILFWEKCIKEYNTKLYRVRSFGYHFQALSARD
jgi:hypothetical protein